MIERKILQQEIDRVASMLQARGSSLDLELFQSLDKKRKEALFHIENLRAKKNILSQEIGTLKRQGKDATAIIEESEAISSEIVSHEGALNDIISAVDSFLFQIPNLLHSSVPFGSDESENVVVREVGSIPSYSFTPRSHWELCSSSGYFDFELASQVTGSRFSFLFGSFSKLERAIGQYCLDIQTIEHGHTEVSVPFIVNRDSLFGTGQLPKFEEDLFKVSPFDYYLIPTAEVPLTNIYANEVIKESMLPLLYTSLTPCFRSEAGSYGRDTKGLIRQHQFMKTEMVHFSHPERSYEQLDIMVSFVERLLIDLELPYRVVTLCSGDTGFSASKTFDIEVWLPSQQVYREISSCSNCEDFQARRANIRFMPTSGGKKQYVHTLNGSGLPLGRTLVAILENYQQEDGSIRIPQVLQKYMGVDILQPSIR